jgi:hypothetical protein
MELAGLAPRNLQLSYNADPATGGLAPYLILGGNLLFDQIGPRPDSHSAQVGRVRFRHRHSHEEN